MLSNDFDITPFLLFWRENIQSISIPNTVKYKGMTFKVTAINKNAFKNQTKAIKAVIEKYASIQ